MFVLIGRRRILTTIDMKKNLLYHCYIKDIIDINKTMIFNLKCLEMYMHIFNGKKIVYVALNNVGRYSNEKIVEALPILKRFDEIHLFENHPIHRESESLIELLGHVKDSTDSISFYAHSKGNTHPIDNTLKNWILCMYYFNLSDDYLKEVEQKLSGNYTTSGILKKDCKVDGIRGDWHYSGAFFWINNKKFFKNEWSTLLRSQMSLESYLGEKIKSSEAFSTFVTESFNFHMNDDLWKAKVNSETIGEKSYEHYNTLLHNLTNQTVL